MLLVFLIIILMISVYLGFCVETNQYTYFGKIKITLVNLIKKIFSCNLITNFIVLPENIRNNLSSIYTYCIFKPNPIIQVNTKYKLLNQFSTFNRLYTSHLCYPCSVFIFSTEQMFLCQTITSQWSMYIQVTEFSHSA